jgi:hypothetical protein
MEEQKKNKESEDLGEAPDLQVKVWGLGVLLNKFDKLLDKMEKIDTKLYFLEKRDKERMDKNQ